ncbi:hypothetical protein PoB_000168300 [Plakobranchus ocellatus]|uniref:Uncharacterized protein n=1 Tax=Plakobranchus ocellatus TaxID=259542 RepID=A0AAV3XY71_9GAST|nr:hypothetical protein PoB_000168300 [Plakobranchus ocellatus]
MRSIEKKIDLCMFDIYVNEYYDHYSFFVQKSNKPDLQSFSYGSSHHRAQDCHYEQKTATQDGYRGDQKDRPSRTVRARPVRKHVIS